MVSGIQDAWGNPLRGTADITKGSLIVGAGPGALGAVGVGADATILTADSTQPSGMKWAAPAPGGANPRGAWSAVTAYAINDVVTRLGGAYRAIATSTNVDPVGNPATWETWTGAHNTNTALGVSSLNLAADSTTQRHNTVAGFQAMSLSAANATGGDNTAIGYLAMGGANVNGGTSTAVGSQSLYLLTTGTADTAVGFGALQNNNTGGSNTAVGDSSLNNISNASNNTAVGANSLLNSNGAGNTAVGYQALSSVATGTNNTALGLNAGFNDGTVTTGSAVTNVTLLGYQAQATASNVIVLGSGVTANRPNLVFGQPGVTAAFGGGVGVFAIANAVTTPASSPVGGGVLYVNAGALIYKGSSGTVTTIAAA